MSLFDFFRKEEPVTKAEIPKPSNGIASVRSTPRSEIGQTGLRIWGGYVSEEFLPELQNARGRQVLREMSDNDATIGAVLTAIDSMLDAVEWRVEPNKKTGDKEAVEFMESVLDDMEHTWEEFMAEVLTYLVFGWSYFEVVYKRRQGSFNNDPARYSKYTDGAIGIRKLAPRAQESLLRWEVNEKGEILGMWQLPPQGGETLYIPSSKALHFRTTANKNNPEGRSILRNAYTSYFYKKKIQIVEAIAIERELAGLPIVKIPSEMMSDETQREQFETYQKIARDLKFNEQGAIIIPSDPYEDATGKPTNIPKVDIELISADGSRHIDTDKIIRRYDEAMARTVLADFLILGSNSRGSFAMSKDKTDMFLHSITGFVNGIAKTVNRNLVSPLWMYNGFDPDTEPRLVPGEVAPRDLTELADYVSKLAGAGIMFAGDQDTERVLRSAAKLPTEVQDLLTPADLNPAFARADENGNGEENNDPAKDPKAAKEKPKAKDKAPKKKV